MGIARADPLAMQHQDLAVAMGMLPDMLIN